MDAVSLFNRVNVPRVAREVGLEYLESEMVIEDVDIRQAAIYVATCCPDSELKEYGLDKIVPRRLYNKGRTPGITTKEIVTRMKTKAKQYEEENGVRPAKDQTTYLSRDLSFCLNCHAQEREVKSSVHSMPPASKWGPMPKLVTK